ncbi:Transient receptor potential cation channel subfamily A member 1, partial [Paramuricea clavata]
MDYYIRHHQPPGGNSENKVERAQSYIVDGLCGGASLQSGGYLKSFVADSIDKVFLFDKEYIDEYLSKPKNTVVPGYHYHQRLEKCLESRCRKGEKCLEFVKFECQSETEGVICDFCDGKDWVGPHVTYVSEPIPDESKLPVFHFLHVRDTPLE